MNYRFSNLKMEDGACVKSPNYAKAVSRSLLLSEYRSASLRRTALHWPFGNMIYGTAADEGGDGGHGLTVIRQLWLHDA